MTLDKEQSLDIRTFGCRLNSYESEVMRDQAQAAGLQEAIIFNTCAVTAEAVRQARQAIRRARRDHPEKPIIVTGCAAQTETAGFAAMEEVDRVVGNAEKLTRAAFVPDFGVAEAERVRVNDIFEVRAIAPHLVDGMAERTRAHVQVQNGCDHRCTFCIIPYGRGNSRSVPMGAVVRQIAHLADKGYGEIVLTGVDLTSYGTDLPGRPRLGKLVRTILRNIPDLPRLRLSSIDSIEADPDLMQALAEEERLMPHLHLSLQAGDDLILKRMKRRHLRADAISFCEEARRRRPDIVFGADLIAGFPTETEDMFRQSEKLIEECGLTYLHVFPFSPRERTPAARMPQLPRDIIRERAARLRRRGAAAFAAHLATERGARRRVLIERSDRRAAFGRTERFTPVELASGEAGQLIDVRITAVKHDRLTAEPLDKAG